MTGDRYSRMVAWLKVVLPLAALALLSTLFLLSRVIDPTASIPFADTEVQVRLRDQQITGPFFSGTTANGDQISFHAEKLTTPAGKTGVNNAMDINVTIDTSTGIRLNLTAGLANYDLSMDRTLLNGDVVITTSSGYTIRSENIRTRMSRLDIYSPGPVEGNSPMGDFSAGQMQISTKEEDAPLQLVFTNGVKLVYDPKHVKD